MRTFATVFGATALLAICVPVAARAQIIDRPLVTQTQLQAFADNIGPALRFRQVGDTETVRPGDVEIGVQYGSTSLEDTARTWNSIPNIAARFGIAERADLGAWGSFNSNGRYAILGADTKIVLFNQGPRLPVSVAIRPSLTGLVGASNVWAASAAVDMSVSRAIGPWSPYGGLAASSNVAIARSSAHGLDPATAGDSFAYAGLSYRWRYLVLAGEVDSGPTVNYAFRVGTRF
jgi:hypothetical protein